MAKAILGNHASASVPLGLCLALAAVMAATSPVLEAGAAGIDAVKNIVLVHGANTDGSGWRGVYDILKKDGYHVSVVQQPLTGLSDDVAATQRVIDQQDGPVILVGHSYGGTIITVAGADPKVRALVYVAALQPDVGETTSKLAASMPGEVAAAAFDAPVTVAAWHNKPSFGIVATADRALNPELARWMYKRSGAKTTEINANHLVYISQPDAVASVIETAARSVGENTTKAQ